MMVIVVVLLVLLVGAAAAGTGAAVLIEAPRCPVDAAPGAVEVDIGAALELRGTVALDDAAATALARRYAGDVVQDARVCFTPGFGHASGKVPLGPVSPSFYATAGVDLSGPVPKTVGLGIKLGGLPDLPLVSDLANTAVAQLIDAQLARAELEHRYAVDFAAGSATIKRLGP